MEKAAMDLFSKIKSLDELIPIIEELRGQGKKIVHCHGVFDLFHPGHLRHLRAAKKEGDILVVTVTRDQDVNKGPTRPVFKLEIRLETLASLEFVDFVAANDWPEAVETIKKLQPHVYVKGNEYRNLEDVTGAMAREYQAVEEIGAKVHFTEDAGFEDVRSTSLINTHFNVFSEETRNFLSEFRNKYNEGEIIDRLESLKNMRVLLIGDAIIDEYHYCKPLGKSLKENMIAMKYLHSETFAGGVFACANHISGFVQQVRLVSCLGSQDSKTDFIVSKLKPNVEPKFFYRHDAPTTVKSRFVEHPYLVKMFEAYYFNDLPLPEEIDDGLYKYLNSIIQDYDLVLVTDYGHGLLNRDTINLIAQKAKILAVNTQTNAANFGFNLITKYPRADYVCIDDPEIRLSTQDRAGAVDDLIKLVSDRLNVPRMIVTRGHLGSVAFEKGDHYYNVPVFSDKIIDRMGAGDAFLSVTSPCVAAGFPMDMVAFIGNAVGAFAVGIIGNRDSIEPIQLFRFIRTLLK